MKIVIDEDIPFIKGVFEPYASVVYLSGKQISHNDVEDADALIVRTRTKCDATLLKGSKISYIASATIGYDHIDTDWCKSNGIQWSNATGSNAESVGQYVLAALLEIARRKEINLRNKTIGIVGVGHVGSVVQRIVNALQMRVLLNDPPRRQKEEGSKFVSLDVIAHESDIITFHTPLIRDGIYKTYHLLDRFLLQKLKRDVILINTSRGEVFDTIVLKEFIQKKQINATILDVWENEPEIDIELLSLVDIATPHIAGYSIDGKGNATEMSVHAISHFFNLPLTNWKIQTLPIIDSPIIDINFNNKTFQQILQTILLTTYNINEDDLKLRQNPADFEHLRNTYPIRREFSNYTVNNHSLDDHQSLILKQINYKLSDNN